MDGDEDILWEGTISGKRFEYILIIVFFLGALLADIGLFFWHPEDFWMVIAKYVCIGGASFIVIIGIIGGTCEMVKGGIKFILTRDQMIYEYNSLLGRRIIETFDLNNLKTLHLNDEFGGRLDNFLFYDLTLAEIRETFPVFQDYADMDEFNTIDVPPNLVLKGVDHPRTLLSALKSLVSLRKHPNLKNVYERVE